MDMVGVLYFGARDPEQPSGHVAEVEMLVMRKISQLRPSSCHGKSLLGNEDTCDMKLLSFLPSHYGGVMYLFSSL